MKKKTVNKPVKKADTLNELRKRDKKTIIVLVIATLIFFGVFFSIYSDDILNNSYEYFTQYDGEEVIEFEKGRVTEIVNEEKEIDEVAENAFLGNQELSVIVGSGRYKGETMLVHNYFGPYNGVPVEVGDMVTITIKTHSDGNHSATVYEINRIPVLAVFILLFFAIIIVVGGYAGLKSLIGLIITIICLFAILIPLLLKGAPPILTTFIICANISMVCFTILGGVQRKSISAFLGTVAGTFFAMVFGIAVQYFSKIDGLRLDEAEALLQLKYAEVANISIRGLLSACIIICALGAVMDVAMSISSSLEEVHAANPKMQKKDLFKSGMNIGRDMVGTMTNTLILAFLGSEFTLVIFLYARDLSFYHLFSTAFVTLETISGISSSIGMVLAIPLTAFISSSLIAREKQ